jgi:hypothetical protein
MRGKTAQLRGWRAFDVGSSREFGVEVERTSMNTALMTMLARRRSKEGRRIPLTEVEKRIGSD